MEQCFGTFLHDSCCFLPFCFQEIKKSFQKRRLTTFSGFGDDGKANFR